MIWEGFLVVKVCPDGRRVEAFRLENGGGWVTLRRPGAFLFDVIWGYRQFQYAAFGAMVWDGDGIPAFHPILLKGE